MADAAKEPHPTHYLCQDLELHLIFFFFFIVNPVLDLLLWTTTSRFIVRLRQ